MENPHTKRGKKTVTKRDAYSEEIANGEQKIRGKGKKTGKKTIRSPKTKVVFRM